MLIETGRTIMTVIVRLRAVSLAISLLIATLLPMAASAQVKLDLRDADMRSFITIVAEATGRSFVLDPQVRGTVTVLSPGGMSDEALYEVFLNVLELNRLTIVPGNNADRIVPLNVARELSSSDGTFVLDGSFETRVIPIQNVPLDDVISVVRPLLPAEAILTPLPRAKMLILSDRGDNFRRIEKLIRQLDVRQEQPIQMIRLRNANAAEVLQVVQSLDIVPEGSTVTVDRRSNALVVSGSLELVDQVRVLASRLDTQSNNLVSAVEQLNYADAASLADVVLRSITNQTPDAANPETIRIVPEPSTNSLLITAPRERVESIVGMIRFLDRRPQQVLVEAVIFEMSSEGFSDLTAQFGGILNDAIVGGVEFTLQGRPSLTSLIAGAASSPGAGGSIGAVNSAGSFAGFLSAITSSNSTRLLSTPSILTLNNQEAEIVVAQNVPFVTGSFTSTGDSTQPENPFQTIERQDVGLTLKVTPQVNADKTVRLDIEQEVSNLTNSSAAAGGEITSRRALSTTVLVRSGNVIMLGGLLEDGSGSVSQKVPGLGDVPLIGGLFRGKNASKSQKVLLIMLRPRLVANDHEAKKLTREAARDASKASLAIRPANDGQFPKSSQKAFPFDGADLNQPFDAGFVDDVAQNRNFPPLPSRLQFRN